MPASSLQATAQVSWSIEYSSRGHCPSRSRRVSRPRRTASELCARHVTCDLAGWVACGKIAVRICSSPVLDDHQLTVSEPPESVLGHAHTRPLSTVGPQATFHSPAAMPERKGARVSARQVPPLLRSLGGDPTAASPCFAAGQSWRQAARPPPWEELRAFSPLAPGTHSTGGTCPGRVGPRSWRQSHVALEERRAACWDDAQDR